MFLVFAVCTSCLVQVRATASDKQAFVLLGATGDNAYRAAGFWTGLFEAWSNGLLKNTDVHAQINKGHTVDSIHRKMMATLNPFYKTLQQDSTFTCQAPDQDCEPQTFYESAQMNVWQGEGKYNAAGQAANMSYLSGYGEVITYMSVPPSAFKDWTEAMVLHWGGGSKVHVAFEKPFGGGRDSLKDATDLHASIIAAGLPEDNFHLTDHWLSFFMLQHLGQFRQQVANVLQMDWSNKDIEKIVVTEYEERGFGGRGAFIDGLGQVRDMVQSHLLQVLALAISDPALPASEGKLKVLDSLSMDGCQLKQFSGLLESKWLKYHPSFADSTFCRVLLSSALPAWKNVEFVIQTGKAMDVNLYTVDVYQRDKPGIITFNIGKEEVGLGDVKVKNWITPTKQTGSSSGTKIELNVAAPGFNAGSMAVTTNVDSEGSGYILDYNRPGLYFPKPYAKIVSALVTHDYSAAFVTWPECKRSWEIVTGSGPAVCLDPPPEAVGVYLPAFLCDKAPALEIAESNGPPELCDQHVTVKQLDDIKYACTDENDVLYGAVDFYKAKCRARKSAKTDL